jgi:uncharacterized protein YkwD
MRVIAGLLALLALTISAVPAQAASTATNLERDVLSMINTARHDHGLRPLRVSGRLWAIAGYRASRMAATNVLSHSVAGSLSSQLKSKGMPWYGYGEDIGYTRSRYGQTAIKDLFRMWKASPSHWKLMMSSKYNYIGVGIARRASNNKTFSSLVFTESPDMTGARAGMDAVGHNGGDTTWAWHGYDPYLVTHTAGLKSYDVQTRVDYGAWRTASYKTTNVTWTWNGLASGHTYGMRVRARDKVGNVGAWSDELRIRIP